MAGFGYCRYCHARIWWGTNPNGNGRPFPFDDEDATEAHFESCSARPRAADQAGHSHTTSKCSQCHASVWWETMPSGAKRPMDVEDNAEGVPFATWTCHFDTCSAREEPDPEPEPKQRRQRPAYVDMYSIGLWLPDLELAWPCTRDDVISNFRRLALKYHPDMGGTTEDFIRIKLAYDRLKQLLPEEAAA